MTGSFKERGACNRILQLTADERARGVVAASAGNHAQGVAYHATRNGARAVIVMPETTPLVKIAATRGYGGEVVLHGQNYDAAFEEAARRAQVDGLTLIHAFDDPQVMAGQGTLGLELLEQNPYLEVVVVAIGGGGLASGVAVAMKETNPRVKVIGVQTARLPSMKEAVAAGQPVTLPGAYTIADGIAVRRAGKHTLPVIQRYLDDIVTVDEDEIANAVLFLLEREKAVAEAAAAAVLAALMQGRVSVHGKKVALVIGGGNIDVTLLSRIIDKGLVKDGRLVRLRVRIPDRPGALHRLTGIVGEVRANILDIAHDRAFANAELSETIVDITCETRGPEHILELEAQLLAGDYVFDRI
jgi:threonine dehydratase